jgi:hypothetical protein
VAPSGADRVGAVEVREAKDVEEFGAGSWPEGVQGSRSRFGVHRLSHLISGLFEPTVHAV